MAGDDPIETFTACPRCDKAPLSVVGSGFRCDACKVDFPRVGGIPWLFAEPEASLGEWRNRLHFALQQLANESQRIRTELDAGDLAELTRQRLEKQADAVDSHRNQLRKLLAPVDVQSSTGSVESYLALRTRLPLDQGISTYYNNVHRDWAWGDEENAASLDMIRQAAGEKPLGNTLVVGAGAARLAYDIHMQLAPTATIAFDFNPLLLLVAQALVRGESLDLYEFPIAPKSIDDFAVARTLAAPEPVRDGFGLVLGDALRPPFGKGAFDTVITPWLIDIIGDDLPLQAARMNQLLGKDGRWINFGSLAFDQPERSRCYSAEETIEIVSRNGFDEPVVFEAEIPYMCSPASRHGRRETVFTFAANKMRNVKAPPRHKALPDWIVTGKEAVPALPSFRSQAMSTQVYSYVMSMIDGQRTIEDMATIMAQQKLMTRDEAIPAIRTFLTRMYDDAQRNSGF